MVALDGPQQRIEKAAGMHAGIENVPVRAGSQRGKDAERGAAKLVVGQVSEAVRVEVPFRERPEPLVYVRHLVQIVFDVS